jgi:hypothetical protein
MKTRLLLAVIVGIPVVAVASYAVMAYWPHDPPPQLAPPREPLLPDLTMPPLIEFLAGFNEGSNTQDLLFTANIANVGRGPFLVHAARGDERGAWRVSQRFLEPDGSTTEAETEGDMVWGGHGHNHWHVELGATYELRAPDGEMLRRYAKVGYCFFDQLAYDLTLPGAPKKGRFPVGTCSEQSTLALDMGLSTGWSDPYQWTLPDQRLDVTGLPDGEYRLWAKADPDDWFRESDETNNVTWADVRLTTSMSPPRVKVIRRSPPVT